MSLKPLKKSEQKAAAKMAARKRKNAIVSMLPEKILIISEGTKTEPNYFRGIANCINDKYRKYTQNKRVICVEGTGCNTDGLYRYLDRNKTPEEMSEYQQIWLVYDKDDFPKDRFDNTEAKARKTKGSNWHTAWSNESFELWLLWHFQDYFADTHRTEYVKLLKNHLQGYDKNDADIYKKVITQGNVNDAIRRAKERIKYYENQNIKTPSKMKAASTVYKLVEVLQSYL